MWQENTVHSISKFSITLEETIDYGKQTKTIQQADMTQYIPNRFRHHLR